MFYIFFHLNFPFLSFIFSGAVQICFVFLGVRMRPPFLFLPTGEKETGRLAVQRKRGVRCKRGAALLLSRTMWCGMASLPVWYKVDTTHLFRPLPLAQSKGEMLRKFPHWNGYCGYFFVLQRKTGAFSYPMPPESAAFFHI